MNSEIEDKKNRVKVMFILDMIGRPKEHLVETLKQIVEMINKEKGIQISNKKINEPVLIENQKDFYSTFAEIEINAESIYHVVGLMFRYMPAHVEVIEPEIITSSNNFWNEVLNEIARRLHGYDEIARVLQVQNAQMQKKLKELMSSIEGKNNPEEIKPQIENKNSEIKKEPTSKNPKKYKKKQE